MPDSRSVPEIREALELLEAYEASSARYEDARRFHSALQMLGDYVAENPDSPHLPFIKNTRLTYIRRMLEGLGRVNKADVKASLEHIVILLAAAGEEAKMLRAEHPELDVALNALIEPWKETIALALIAVEEKRERRKR